MGFIVEIETTNRRRLGPGVNVKVYFEPGQLLKEIQKIRRKLEHIEEQLAQSIKDTFKKDKSVTGSGIIRLASGVCFAMPVRSVLTPLTAEDFARGPGKSDFTVEDMVKRRLPLSLRGMRKMKMNN